MPAPIGGQSQPQYMYLKALDTSQVAKTAPAGAKDKTTAPSASRLNDKPVLKMANGTINPILKMKLPGTNTSAYCVRLEYNGKDTIMFLDPKLLPASLQGKFKTVSYNPNTGAVLKKPHAPTTARPNPATINPDLRATQAVTVKPPERSLEQRLGQLERRIQNFRDQPPPGEAGIREWARIKEGIINLDQKIPLEGPQRAKYLELRKKHEDAIGLPERREREDKFLNSNITQTQREQYKTLENLRKNPNQKEVTTFLKSLKVGPEELASTDTKDFNNYLKMAATEIYKNLFLQNM